MNKQKILDSLTPEQRKGIAEIIRSTIIDGDYRMGDEDGGSVWCEDCQTTLNSLAAEFDLHDSESVLGREISPVDATERLREKLDQLARIASVIDNDELADVVAEAKEMIPKCS